MISESLYEAIVEFDHILRFIAVLKTNQKCDYINQNNFILQIDKCLSLVIYVYFGDIYMYMNTPVRWMNPCRLAEGHNFTGK